MNAITFPLKKDMRGQSVAELHAALQIFIGRSEINLPDHHVADFGFECQRQEFGVATRYLVREYQKRYRLSVTGDVDESTAAKLNDKLREWGLLEEPPQPPPPEQTYVVTGQVRREDGSPLQGVQWMKLGGEQAAC